MSAACGSRTSPLDPDVDFAAMKRELADFRHARGREIHRRKGHTNYGAAAAAVSIVECVRLESAFQPGRATA